MPRRRCAAVARMRRALCAVAPARAAHFFSKFGPGKPSLRERPDRRVHHPGKSGTWYSRKLWHPVYGFFPSCSGSAIIYSEPGGWAG